MINHDEPGKPKKPPTDAWFWSAVGVFICVIIALLIFRVDVEGILLYSNRLAAFPTVEADYRRYYDAALGASQQVWLNPSQDYDRPLELLRGRFYRGCIRAGFSYTYRTDKPYAEIREYYRSQLSYLGWQDRGNDYWSGISNVRAHLSIERIDDPRSGNFEIGRSKYRTTFRLSLAYADPARNRCQG
ncbi:hypothetical protein ANRL4_03499 [Anaerolineae bacterium]|nr:hypothetical protein ANRL4_03499 [Anaerolineae bacterium]